MDGWMDGELVIMLSMLTNVEDTNLPSQSLPAFRSISWLPYQDSFHWL